MTFDLLKGKVSHKVILNKPWREKMNYVDGGDIVFGEPQGFSQGKCINARDE